MTVNERNRVIELQHKGYGYKRIASAIGLPVNTVKSFCSRHPIRDDEILELKGLCRNCRTPIEQTPHKQKSFFARIPVAWHGECSSGKGESQSVLYTDLSVLRKTV